MVIFLRTTLVWFALCLCGLWHTNARARPGASAATADLISYTRPFTRLEEFLNGPPEVESNRKIPRFQTCLQAEAI